MKKARPQVALKRPGSVDLQEEDEGQLRRLIDMCPSLPQEPEVVAKKKEKLWLYRKAPGIKKTVETVGKTIVEALLPPNPKRNKKP